VSVTELDRWVAAYLVDGPLARRHAAAPLDEDGEPLYRYSFVDEAGRSHPYEFALRASGPDARALYYSTPPARFAQGEALPDARAVGGRANKRRPQPNVRCAQ